MKFIVATKNKKKLSELMRILSPMGIDIISEAELPTALPEVEETGETFLENARLKAVSAMQNTGLPAIADDSGLCVDALDGRPGVYSARYSGQDATDEKNNEKLLFEMMNVPNDSRGARFVSAICLVFPDGNEITAYGECKGRIAFERHGNGGFGYDPIFLVGEKSFGELPAEEKDSLSHRGKALNELSKQLGVYLRG